MANARWEEYRRKTPNGKEREALFELDMLRDSVTKAVRKLTENGHRLDGYKWLARDIKLIERIITKILIKAYESIDPDYAVHLKRQSRDFTIGIKRRSEPEVIGDEVLIPVKDEAAFVSVILDSRCKQCMATAEEAAKCDVRSLLRKYGDEPDPQFRECGYMWSELEWEDKQ